VSRFRHLNYCILVLERLNIQDSDLNEFLIVFEALGICIMVHSKLCSIIHAATNVHVILRSVVVLTWMHDTIDLV